MNRPKAALLKLTAAGFAVLILPLAGCGKTMFYTYPAASPISEGTTSSGGGDSLELEFKITGRSLERRLKDRNPKLHAQFNFDKWRAALEKSTIVAIDDRPFHDGRPVDALNFPSLSLVNIFSKKWQMLNAWERERLVLHETFALAGMNDRGYILTDDVLKHLDSISLVTYTQITIDGPSASSFAENFDWTGAIVIKIPEMISSGKNRYMLSLLYKSDPFIHCVGNSSKPLGKTIAAHEKFTLENPTCMLALDGTLQGSHTAVFNTSAAHRFGEEKQREAAREKRATELRLGRFLEFWKRLGGISEEFNYPSIAGTSSKDYDFREVRIHIELRR